MLPSLSCCFLWCLHAQLVLIVTEMLHRQSPMISTTLSWRLLVVTELRPEVLNFGKMVKSANFKYWGFTFQLKLASHWKKLIEIDVFRKVVVSSESEDASSVDSLRFASWCHTHVFHKWDLLLLVEASDPQWLLRVFSATPISESQNQVSTQLSAEWSDTQNELNDI